MNDMSTTIIAKSDQINAADLVGISRTITVKEVRIKAGEDQPVTILIEGDKKAFRPCKGVRRLLVRVWGPDANKYIGQSLTLYCDPTVTWAGKPEGGIRVSHMTGLDEKIVEYMRTSREKTKPYTIEPLVIDAPKPKSDVGLDAVLATLKAIAKPGQMDALGAAWKEIGPEARKALAAELPALKAVCEPAPEPEPPAATEADDPTLASWLIAIAAAPDDAAVNKLDKDSELDRGFFTPEQCGQLDQALAARREAIRKSRVAEGVE